MKWKTYNREEVDEIMYSYIKETSEDLKIHLWNNIKQHKEVLHV